MRAMSSPRDVIATFRSSVAGSASDRRAWLAVFLGCLPLYLLTAHYGWTSGDTRSAVLPAWQLVHHGSLWVEHMNPRPAWSVPAIHGHMVSNRMPGVELVNVPLVAMFWWLGPSVVPMALTAATMTAATVAFLYLTFRRLVSTRLAFAATLVAAFGTSLWTVASAEVFPHTVDAFCIAVTMYALSRERIWLAGLAVAAAIPARPHMAAVALVVGVGLSWVKRSWRPLLVVGVPATLGLTGLFAWNYMLYGHASISGGYASYVVNTLTTTSASSSSGGLVWYLVNIAGFLVSPQRGLFVFLPVAVVLLFGVRRAWRVAPAWVRIMAVGGVAYSAIQLHVNRFDGGQNFYAYRLATELVVCTAPLLVLATAHWAVETERRMRLTRALAAVSIGLQAVGAFAFTLADVSPSRPWHASPVLDALSARPAVAMFLLLATVAVSLRFLRPPRTVRRDQRPELIDGVDVIYSTREVAA
jgi:hypothetical protein